jgi:hypothetical protein
MSKLPKAHVISVEPIMAVVTPFMMARISDDLYKMADRHESGHNVPLARYYVLCASIEIGLKSAILANDCTSGQKKAIKAMGHDLLKVHSGYAAIYPDVFDHDDLNAVSEINPYFKSKGLEYFTTDLLYASLEAFKKLPSLESLRIAAAKVNKVLTDNELFIDGKSTEPPGHGIISFV